MSFLLMGQVLVNLNHTKHKKQGILSGYAMQDMI